MSQWSAQQHVFRIQRLHLETKMSDARRKGRVHDTRCYAKCHNRKRVHRKLWPQEAMREVGVGKYLGSAWSQRSGKVLIFRFHSRAFDSLAQHNRSLGCQLQSSNRSPACRTAGSMLASLPVILISPMRLSRHWSSCACGPGLHPSLNVLRPLMSASGKFRGRE